MQHTKREGDYGEWLHDLTNIQFHQEESRHKMKMYPEAPRRVHSAKTKPVMI